MVCHLCEIKGKEGSSEFPSSIHASKSKSLGIDGDIPELSEVSCSSLFLHAHLGGEARTHSVCLPGRREWDSSSHGPWRFSGHRKDVLIILVPSQKEALQCASKPPPHLQEPGLPCSKEALPFLPPSCGCLSPSTWEQSSCLAESKQNILSCLE